MLTPPFATTSDLANGWRPLSPSEVTRATELLRRASQKLLAADRWKVFADLLTPTQTMTDVVCAMVQRAMPTLDAAPVTQESQAWGPFSQQRTYGSPSGDLYITKAERRDLGLLRQRASGVSMWEPPA